MIIEKTGTFYAVSRRTDSEASANRKNPVATTKNKAPSADSVALSRKGQAASKLGLHDSILKGSTVTLENIAGRISSGNAYVRQRLDSFMASLGIDRNVSYSLTVTGTGRIAVSGDFAGKERIEAAVNGDEEFRNTFVRLSADSSLYEAARKALEFQKAYAADQKSAVARYASLFDDNAEYRFTFTYDTGRYCSHIDTVRAIRP